MKCIDMGARRERAKRAHSIYYVIVNPPQLVLYGVQCTIECIIYTARGWGGLTGL